MTDRKRPLWTCPQCGHKFVTRNMWHSCGNYSLKDHFKGRDHTLRTLFKRLVVFVTQCGPPTVYAQKSRIVFQTRGRFIAVVVRKNWIECGLWFKRRGVSPRWHRVLSLLDKDFVHYFKLTHKDQLDAELAQWVGEAYVVGSQNYRKEY